MKIVTMTIKVITLLYINCFLAFSFANIKFDHSNCMEMKPQITHSGAAKNNHFLLTYAKLYSIHISSSRFQADFPIKIVIKSCKAPDGINHGMQAFLLQARTLDTKFRPIGHFNRSKLQKDTEAISCFYPYDSIVSKTNAKVKELVVSWIPPRNYRGRIAFYFTAVPHGTNYYYLRVKSPVLHMGNGTSVALEQKCYSSASKLAFSPWTLIILVFAFTGFTIFA